MPGSYKTCNQFPIQFFLISRCNHSKWLCSYVNHISGYVLTLNETVSRPFFPNEYPFFIAECFLVNLICVLTRKHLALKKDNYLEIKGHSWFLLM